MRSAKACSAGRRLCSGLLLLVLVGGLCAVVWAKTPQPVSDTPVRLDTELYALPADDPSGRLVAVLRLTPAPGWHAYSADSVASGQPASANLHAGDAPAQALFPPGDPKPDAFEPEKTVRVYEAPTPIYVPLSEAQSGAPALTGQVRVFSCSDVSCWPSSFSVRIPLAGQATDSLPPAKSASWWPQFSSLRQAAGRADPPGASVDLHAVAAPSDPAAPDVASPPVAASEAGPGKSPAPSAAGDLSLSPRSFTPALEVTGLLKAALLAFVAGLVLNFMPCVLPVVSLKLSGLLAICGEEGKRERLRTLREHNFFFALGIVVYFLCLSTLLGAFGLAWGEMFQMPWLAMVVAVVLFALSLSLFGLFHLPVIDLKVPGGGRGHTRRGAFLTGVLATLLATPCSGPFLGGVLAWTLLRPLPEIMTIFAVIGLGMAAPYAVLAIWPRLARFLPRPGGWMTGLERAMAFVLAGSCIYFLSLVPPARLPAALFALWAVGLGAYIYGRGTNLSQSPAKRLSLRGLALAVAGGGVALALFYTPPDETRWLAYSPESFEERLGKENLVVDFTADWCPTCKFLERTVLTPPRLKGWANRHGAAFIKVDLTGQHPRAMALLRRLGSQSIPVVAFFPAGPQASAPLVLRDLYTTSQFEQALHEAFGRSPRVASSR
ncbi:MAG: cytochrome c biogenesis protein CcdA [Desulfovibrionaceae bacterium]